MRAPRIKHKSFSQFSLSDSALWLFVKSRRKVKLSNLKTIFNPSLGTPPVSRPNLLN